MPSKPVSRSALLRALRETANRFDADANARKRAALLRLAALPLKAAAALADYYDTLLFIAAHPPDTATHALVAREFKRIAAFLKALRAQPRPALADRGLPWVDTVSRFSHDCVRWLLAHPHCRVRLERCEAQALLDLNAVLRLTLPALERGETTAGLDNDALLAALKVKPARRLAFIVGELSRLDTLPLVKDQLFDALDVYVRVQPRSAAFAKSGNRLPVPSLFIQPDLLRRFDAVALMNQPLPAPRRLSAREQDGLIRVLRDTMTLTVRETDPITYLDPGALRLYELERGLACAIFGMTPARQLPLESYVGFVLFKNGLPVSYGGSWVMGERATFGMNIFEPFRGGESGYMMCQLLRTYRQAFDVRYFEVEPYQFGLDNPDGIASGAFWFYYRYGFRPLEPALARLAAREKKRIDQGDGYRSTEKTLLRFTESNVALNFGGPVPPHLADITARVTQMIATDYADDRLGAERDCTARFRATLNKSARAGAPVFGMGCEAQSAAIPCGIATFAFDADRPSTGCASRDGLVQRCHKQAAALPDALTPDECRVLAEVALIWRALNVRDAEGIALLAQMVRVKPHDVWAYQTLLLKFFARPRAGRARQA
ncbi:MAG: hypothetical protein LBE78_01725 [Burkholderiaceae bacterium]|jgi:hypothetical protein|nr:hypothetical protein [Burkholderiaceae bacterium]